MRKIEPSKISENWTGWLYQFTTNSGQETDAGKYEDVFQIGLDEFVISPYWTDLADFMVMSAAEVLNYISVKAP